MVNVTLGRTGITVQKNGFGALPIQRISRNEAAYLLQKALDGGFTFFDTARAYTDSEEKIGFALSSRRDRFFLATKTAAQTAEDFWNDLHTSLNNLNTGYVDILQLHNPAFCPKPGDGSGLYEAMCQAREEGKTVSEIVEVLGREAAEIKEEDIRVCRSIGEYGLSLVKPGDGILTHCNAGQLATCKYGTATAPIYLGQERGYNFRVFADETRPLLQGARLTAYELSSAGVDVTLICDNMSATVMRNGWVNAVFVGCDRVAANGDVANKIGTSVVAAVARRYGVPFYVCAPTSTIDMAPPTGGEIKIEQRPPEEVTQMWYRERMAPEGVKVFNPAFDVTDHELVTAIITERGIARAPFKESLAALFNRG